jgi:hypothetical protein
MHYNVTRIMNRKEIREKGTKWLEKGGGGKKRDRNDVGKECRRKEVKVQK